MDDLLARLSTLTTREIEVLTLIGEGLTHAEIAQRLKRSQKTIESHRLSIGRKLKVRKQVELARIAITAGFVNLAGGLGRFSENPDARTVPAAALRTELSRRKKSQEILRSIDAATTAVAGEAFLTALVASLARSLDVRCVAIAQIVDPSRQITETVAGMLDGMLLPPTRIALGDTPWVNMPAVRSRLIRTGLLSAFPADPLVRHAHADSGAGSILTGPDGEAIGFLCVLHNGRLDESLEPELLLRLFAGRAAAELVGLRAQRRLAESEERYRLLANHSVDMIGRHTPDGIYTYVSPASRELLGYEPDELIGRTPYEFFHPEDLAAIAALHDGLRTNFDPERIRYRFRRKDGTYTWIETDVRSVGDPGSGRVQSMVTSSRDVSEQQAAAAELVRVNEQLEQRVAERTSALTAAIDALTESRRAVERNEERWRALVRDASDYIVIVDADLRVQYVNRLLADIEYADVIGQPLVPFVPPEQRERFEATLRSVLEQGVHCTGEFESVMPTGKRVWEDRFSPISIDDRVVGVGIIATDITERRATELAIRDSEERYRRLVEMAPDGILAHDGALIRLANRSLASILGAPEPSCLVGRPVLSLVHPKYHDHVRQRIRRLMVNDEPAPRARLELLRLDGSIIEVETSGTAYDANGQRMVQVIVREVGVEVVRISNQARSQERGD
ncbi:MAG: PAS domain S-box protein [Phycisphaerales bacterium]|nr:PAS domain S-box protein [Phycisphaerales bacterium]